MEDRLHSYSSRHNSANSLITMGSTSLNYWTTTKWNDYNRDANADKLTIQKHTWLDSLPAKICNADYALHIIRRKRYNLACVDYQRIFLTASHHFKRNGSMLPDLRQSCYIIWVFAGQKDANQYSEIYLQANAIIWISLSMYFTIYLTWHNQGTSQQKICHSLNVVGSKRDLQVSQNLGRCFMSETPCGL
jgi:hypothetical protein